MEPLFLILIGLGFVLILIVSAKLSEESHDDAAASSRSTGGGAQPAAGAERSLLQIAQALEPQADSMAQPVELREHSDFKEIVERLANDEFDAETVGDYAIGSNWVLRCAACAAFEKREDGSEAIDRVLKDAHAMGPWPLIFMLDFIQARASGDVVVVKLLKNISYFWKNDTRVHERISAFIKARMEAGEKIDLGRLLVEGDGHVREELGDLIKKFPDDVAAPLRESIRNYKRTAIDRRFLRSVGEFVGDKDLAEPVFDTAQISVIHQEMLSELDSDKPRSILVIGEPGVGKSAIRRRFAQSLRDRGWHVFKTSAANIIADKSYVGEIEGQIRRLAENATTRKKVVLYVDRIQELAEFGRHKMNSTSLLDQLWPDIERGNVFLVSETTSDGLQRIARGIPNLLSVAKVVQLQAVGEAEAADLSEALLKHLCKNISRERSGEVVDEALQLSQQYLTHKALPGSVLSLLELAVLRAQREEVEIPSREHVLAALSQISGLPREVLDEKQNLDIGSLREAFRRRVIGQDEAVDCLVERIAMLKAGLTDPGRPVGVFLFAGPTGTGKTEIAKRLAELLFGSPEQMIRLDMSEFQSADSTWRLLGRPDSGESDALVNQIRRQPFSVVLLDEFEKAHSKVWDLFLQVFDDGRMTDSQGQLADFRHSIIILTSNIGAKISAQAGLGFTSKAGDFSKSDVLDEIQKAFRPEFVNRLDRVVVFNPLSREVMRAILKKELRLLLGRRGLRTRQWVIEYEESALEYLLQKGFTPDLGARPVRRAIEQYLLAPLSMTMVQNQAPAGEQFMFIRSDGRGLQVEFVDPDAEAGGGSEAAASTGTSGNLADIILASNLRPDSPAILEREASAILERIDGEAWAEMKADLLAQMNHEDFWARVDRYRVLDRIELADRIESAGSTLRKRVEMLDVKSDDVVLAKDTANRVYVLGEGITDLDLDRATQAYIGARIVTDDLHEDGADEFLQRITQMYRQWAEVRGMRIRDLEADDTSRYATIFLVSGFGCYGLLELESGVHIWETPRDGGRFARIRARVKVAPVPEDGANTSQSPVSKATRILDGWNRSETTIVRRYRELPSPLARDSVRGWRTGRLDRVLDGNFDLLT